MKDINKILIMVVLLVLAIVFIPKYYSNDVVVDSVKCLPEQRNARACIEIYQPVCASVSVMCFSAPCNPSLETFSNSCFACANEYVIEYVVGEC